MGSRPKLQEFEKCLTPEEKDKVLEYLSKPEAMYTREGSIIRLVLKTGLRASEVAHLKKEHCLLEGEHPQILVYGGKKREADHADSVKISIEFAEFLKIWLKRSEPREYVFESNDHKHGLTRNTIWAECKKVYQLLGLNSKYGVHALRHRFVTDTYKAFRDPVVTMNQARHKGLGMTTRYIHLATEESEDFRDKLSKV